MHVNKNMGELLYHANGKSVRCCAGFNYLCLLADLAFVVTCANGHVSPC